MAVRSREFSGFLGRAVDVVVLLVHWMVSQEEKLFIYFVFYPEKVSKAGKRKCEMGIGLKKKWNGRIGKNIRKVVVPNTFTSSSFGFDIDDDDDDSVQ